MENKTVKQQIKETDTATYNNNTYRYDSAYNKLYILENDSYVFFASANSESEVVDLIENN